MAGLVKAEMRGDVRLIWLLAGPSNLFSSALCGALHQALTEGFADVGTAGIVLASGLRGPGQGFSGGMDLADLARDWPGDAPRVVDVVRLMLGAQKPVIAALHGACLGAGAEIALAAWGRVAAADLRFGLRDGLVGLLPGAGGTQTLPRLVGAAEALRLIGRGMTVTGAEAAAAGIVDAVAADVVEAGVLMARMPPEAGRAPGLRDGRGYQVAVAVGRKAAGGDALLMALADCVEAAQILPMEQGMAFEAEAAAEIAARPEAGALQHVMMAEMRMAAALGGGAAAGRIGLWGAGAGPLVWPALHAGLEVVFADDDRAALLAEVEKVALAQEGQVTAGRLTPAARDAEWGRLRPGVAASDMAGLDLVIAAKPGVAGAQVLHLGVWPEQAADAARLLLVAPGMAELQLGARRDGWALQAAATLRRMRMRFAVTGAPPAGGVARTLVRAARSACTALLTRGISYDSLEMALEGYLRMPLPDDLGGTTVMEVAQVRARLDGALAAAGAELLLQGAVRRAGDIDVLAVAALGLPRASGGPLFAADQKGLMIVRRDLVAWAEEHPVWTPPVLLDQLISEGKRLAQYAAVAR